MSQTPKWAIPYVPENTLDPAAGLNVSLLRVDAALSEVRDDSERVLVAGTNITINRTNPDAPVISSTGGSAVWGAITGVLGNQADLASALAGKVDTTDARLSDSREWAAETVSQVEAEAGTADTRRAWTAQRVRQAIVAWWNSVSSAWGRGFVASADAAAGRTALELGSAATRTALGTTGALYSRDSILGTVSQLNGVPTGAIIERGSNANGEYVRWADGTQICWGQKSGAHMYIFNMAIGAYGWSFVAQTEYFTFPATFSAPPQITGNAGRRASDGTGVGGLASCESASATGCQVSGWVQTGDNRIIGYIAIGRWY